MRTTAFALFTVATGILGACEGSEVRRPLSADGFVTDADGDDDGDVGEGDGDVGGEDGDDTPDGDVTPLVPTVEFWFVGRNGELGRGVDEVTLLAEDEEEEDLASAGFQTAVSVATVGVAAGEEVRFFVGDFTQGTAVVTVEDGVGSATFPELTLPESGSTIVRIETVDTDGEALVASKNVTVDAGVCVITAALRVGANGCVALDANAIVAPFEAATIEVQRTAGPCTRVGGTATLGATSITLAQTSFGADGSAELVIPIDPGTTFVGDVDFDLVAAHPDDSTKDGTASGSARLDRVAPVVTWVAPAADTTTLTLADDGDGDDANGIQYEVRVSLDLALDETATAALFVAEVQVGEVIATGPGDITFGQITFAADGPAGLRVAVADGCDNAASATLQLDIVATPDTLVILTPDDGAVLLAAGDGDATTATIYETRFDVSANAAEAGTLIEVLCQAATDLDPDNWTLVGTLTVVTIEAAATYAVPVAVDVDALGAATRCVARMTTPSALVSEAVRVTFAIPAPTIVIAQPLDGACIVAGTIGFAGTATGLDGRSLAMTGVSPGPADGPLADPAFATVGAGAASGDWSATYAAGDFDGRYTFDLSATDAFGNPTATVGVSVTVDRAPPTLAITAPAEAVDGLVTPDADATTPGYQTAVTLAVSEATTLVGGEVCLAVNGATPVCQALGNAVAFLGVTLVAGANELVVSGRDGCGNPAVNVSQTVTLTLDNPIAIVAPANNSTLLAAGDATPSSATTYDMTVTVDADRAAAGAAIVIECRADGGTTFTTVGTTTIATVAANGVYAVNVAVDTLMLGTSVECRARVDLPNAGVSDVVDYVLALPAPTLALTAPVANACLRADIAAAGTATALDGRVVTASLVELDGDVVVSNTGMADAGAWATTLALGTTADGAYGILASATDVFGNPASTGTAVGVVVDRTAPVLALTAPASPEVVAADDSAPAGGFQIDVVASYQDARAGGQVCLAIGVAAAVCQAATATVTFADVTLQPGDNTLTLTGSDACGNAATTVTVTRRLELDAPNVAITTPAANLTTAATTIDIVATVTDGDNVPLAGLTVVLLKGGVETGLTAVGAANGTYTFVGVPLTAGAANTFTAEAERPNSATGISGPRIVTQKNTTPTIAISTPTTGTLFVASSAACQVGQTNCVTSVAVTTTNVEDGSAATLSVACGAAPVVYNATVTANAATFVNVVLTNGQTCTLTPGVTDLAAQTATGAVVTVSVDRTAPTVVITSPDAVLQAADDADAVTSGLQYALSATIGGVAANATVTAVLSWNDGAPQTKTLTHTVTTTTADGGSYIAGFEDAATPGLVTWPDGVVTLVVSVSDVNGNATSTTLQVTIDGSSSIRITGPATVPAETCGAGCASGTTCHDGACWIAWGSGVSRQIVTFVSGIQTTSNNVRVCSDDPSLAGTGAATCVSAASATGPYRQVHLGSTSGGITILDVSSELNETFQRLVAEVLPVTGGSWISSLSAVSPNERLRRVDVDLQTPAVTTISSPSDTIAPIGTLNFAEQAALPRAYDISFSVSEAGHADVYVNGSIAVSLDVVAGVTTTRVTLPEGTPQVWVVISDAVGNRSPTSPGLGALTYQPTVDVTAPTLTFTRPSKSPLKQGDILDVVLTSNAEGRTVTVFDGATQVASGVVTSGSVTFSDPGFMTEGSHTLSATVSDVAGNITIATTIPATVVVDTVPPSGVIVSPTDGAVSDADPGTPGFQVAVDFTTADGASTWSLSSAKGCSILFANCQTPVVEATGNVTVPNGAEPQVLITVDTDASVTQQKVILTTYDDALNSHTDEVLIQVSVVCAVSFGNLPATRWYNATSCATPGCTTTDVDIQVSLVGLCGLTVDSIVLSDGTTDYPAAVPPSNHTFTITINDGDDLALEAKAFDGANELASTGLVPVRVDLTAPQVTFIATTVGGFVTPAEGASVSYDYLDDLDPGAAGMQLNAEVQVTDVNADQGVITSLTATSSGTVNLTPTNPTIPLTLTGASPIIQDLLGLTLADDATHTVTVTATDAAGNVDSSTFTAAVDVTRPEVVAVTDLTIDRRRPRFTLTWTAVGVAADLPAAYEIRYSAQPIVGEADWTAACDASLVYGSDVIPAPAPAGTSMTAAFGGPDTRSNSDPCRLDVRFDEGAPTTDPALYIAVRARDDNGNLSALAAESMRTVTNGELANNVSLVRFDNSANVFGASGALITRRGSIIGDITGDGRPEWAVFSLNTSGFCIFRGLAAQPDEVTVNTLSGPNHTCLIGASASAFFAGVTQAGHHVVSLGDLNGDGLGDFGVSARITNGSTTVAGEGYVVVYLGASGVLPTLTAPNLRFRGISIGTGGAFGGEYSGFCSAGDFDGLATGNTTTSDLVIAEPFTSFVHVIPGQTTWTNATNLSFDLSVSTTLSNAAIDGGLAAWTVSAPGLWGVASSKPILGVRCAPAGDILPTPAGLGTGAKDDILVLQAGSTDSRVFLFPGRTFSPGTTVTVSEIPTTPVAGEDARSLRLRQELSGLLPNFGLDLQGDVDLTNDGVPDVLIGHPGRRVPTGDGKTIYVFDGAALPALAGGDVRITVSGDPVDDSWVGVNGWVMVANINTSFPFAVRAVGDFDGWLTGGLGTVDIAFGDGTGVAVFLKLNHERPAASIELGQYPVLDGEIVNRYRPPNTGSSIGTWVDGGVDLTGDGLTDIITGSNLGDVLIVH